MKGVCIFKMNGIPTSLLIPNESNSTYMWYLLCIPVLYVHFQNVWQINCTTIIYTLKQTRLIFSKMHLLAICQLPDVNLFYHGLYLTSDYCDLGLKIPDSISFTKTLTFRVSCRKACLYHMAACYSAIPLFNV